MPRATTKADLIKSANEQFNKLLLLAGTIPADKRLADFCFDAESVGVEAHWKRDKNLRDVFAHLYEWHRLLLNWVASNQNGELIPFLPFPYTWKTYGEMNVRFWEMHQSTTYASAEIMLLNSHRKVIALIEQFSDKELFEKQHFTWTGTTSLGSYCVSASSSHYDWAIKKIKKYEKESHNRC